NARQNQPNNSDADSDLAKMQQPDRIECTSDWGRLKINNTQSRNEHEQCENMYGSGIYAEIQFAIAQRQRGRREYVMKNQFDIVRQHRHAQVRHAEAFGRRNSPPPNNEGHQSKVKKR